MHTGVADDILLHCDRTKSQEARYALRRLFWQPLKKSGIKLHPSCVLSPEKDVLSAQESQKKLLTDGLWQCSLCGKMFKTEHYLDKHLARKHPLFRHEEGRVCFAEMCGSLIPCVPLTRDVLPSISSVILNESGTQDVAKESYSDEKSFCHHAGLKQKRIHACSEVLHRCMKPPRHRFLSWPAQVHFERFKYELCERAIQVECVKREDVWSVVGKPNDVLRSGSWIPLHRIFGWAVLICTLVVFLVFVGFRKAIPQRKRKVRRRLRRKTS